MYINKINLTKYLTQFIIVTISSYLLSPCDIKYYSIIFGLISASFFAILDTYYPIIVYKDKFI